MERIATLREQASVLRTLASSFDIQSIRDQLLDLAVRCEQLAESLEYDMQAPPSTGSVLTHVPERAT
jgi:hypothetical protein